MPHSHYGRPRSPIGSGTAGSRSGVCLPARRLQSLSDNDQPLTVRGRLPASIGVRGDQGILIPKVRGVTMAKATAARPTWKKVLARKGPLLLPAAPDGLTARLIERAG